MKTPLSIGNAWEETVAFVKREGQLLFPVAFALVALPSVIMMLMIPPEFSQINLARKDLPALPPSLVLGLLLAVFISLIGMLTVLVLALRPGVSVAEALQGGVRRLPVLLGAALLVGAAGALVLLVISLIAGVLVAATGAVNGGVALATLLFVALFVYLSVRLILLNAVVAEGRTSVTSSLKLCWQITAGHFWRLLAFFVVTFALLIVVQGTAQAVFGVMAGLVAGPGAARLIGGIASAAVATVVQVYFLVMTARIYRQLTAAG